MFKKLVALVFVGIMVSALPSVTSAEKTVVYTSLGEELSRYELDAEKAALVKAGSVTLPANLQFAAFHPSNRYLYAVVSNAGSGTLGAAGDTHLLSSLKLDAKTGALQPYGPQVILPERPIHVTVDRAGRYALVAFNKSGTVRVYQILKDGSLGEEVAQATKPDGGIFTHQVVVSPDNASVIALARGNEAVQGRAAEIGSRSTFNFADGKLTLIEKVAYDDGIGPRHLAFHPTQPWVYVGIERGSKLFMHTIKDGVLSKDALYKEEALQDLGNMHRDRQKGGVVMVHPSGKFVYVTNRADGTVKEGNETFWAGGENNIAVFAIDEKTGKPTLIQHVDGQGIEMRTFGFDPSGKLLIAANQKTMKVRDGGNVSTVPANIAIFRIGADGKLDFVRKYDVDAGKKWLLWMDVLALK